MKQHGQKTYMKQITVLVILIIIFAAIASSVGIFYTEGEGNYSYKTIRGEVVTIFGRGLYRHMTEEVAIQGIGQDYVTFFIGIPLLCVALLWTRKGSVQGKLLLSGILGYFFVGYLFYMIMGMYNQLFMIYVVLAGLTFFGLVVSLFSLHQNEMYKNMLNNRSFLRTYLGIFLLVNSVAISILWLEIVLPPLFDGTIFPVELAHYTTLIVQGMDLGLLLPIAFVAGILLLQKKPLGYLFASVYSIFLTLHMIALTGKIITMGMYGYSIIPVVFIIPSFVILSGIGAISSIRSASPKG